MHGYVQRPTNCDPAVGTGGNKCPECDMFHLRPGYCAALDPVNPVYRRKHGVDSSVDNPKLVDTIVDSSEPDSVDSGQSVDSPQDEEARKAYKRQWMREKRAREKSNLPA